MAGDVLRGRGGMGRSAIDPAAGGIASGIADPSHRLNHLRHERCPDPRPWCLARRTTPLVKALWQRGAREFSLIRENQTETSTSGILLRMIHAELVGYES